MKKVKFYLTHTLYEHANKNIREKSDVIRLLLDTIPEIFVSNEKDSGLGSCEIIIDKMSRIIYTLIHEGKIYKKFSINFPFIIKNNEQTYEDDMFYNKWLIYDIEGQIITNQVVSILKILCDDNVFKERICASIEPLDSYEKIYEAIKEVDAGINITEIFIWRLIRYLYLFESGYLRYDFDDDPSRCDEVMHPLHHLDFYFSSNVTLKLGIAKDDRDYLKWRIDSFDKLIDNTKPCYYLKLI